MLYYLNGGGRSAAFTHGVCAMLEDNNAKIPDTIVCNSAGLLSALTIALGKTVETKHIYDDFVRQDTLHIQSPYRFMINTIALVGRTLGVKPGHPKHTYLIDAQKIIEVIKSFGIKLTDLPEKPKIYVELLNRKTGQIELKSITNQSTWRDLEVAINCVPYYEARDADGNPELYADSRLSGARGYTKLLERFDEKEMLVVDNHPQIIAEQNNALDVMNSLLGSTLAERRLARNKQAEILNSQAELQLLQARDDLTITVLRPQTDDAIPAYANSITKLQKNLQAGFRAVVESQSELKTNGFLTV